MIQSLVNISTIERVTNWFLGQIAIYASSFLTYGCWTFLILEIISNKNRHENFSEKTFIENIIYNNLSWFRKFQIEIDHKWNSGLNTRIIVDVIAVTTAVQGRISKLKFTTWSFPQDFVLCLMSFSCSILEILSPNEKVDPGFFIIYSHLIGTGHSHSIWTANL